MAEGRHRFRERQRRPEEVVCMLSVEEVIGIFAVRCGIIIPPPRCASFPERRRFVDARIGVNRITDVNYRVTPAGRHRTRQERVASDDERSVTHGPMVVEGWLPAPRATGVSAHARDKELGGIGW